jgi:hypothetical protein
MSGTKFDEGKPPCSLISSDALLELSRVLGYGANKYSSHNWRSGFKWSRVMDAALRHIYRYNSGERIDPETGISHLTHAFCNLMFLVDFEKNNVGENDLWSGYPVKCNICGCMKEKPGKCNICEVNIVTNK